MREITLKIPDKLLPCRILKARFEFDHLPFGKSEKAMRLLKRALMSLEDNKENREKYRELTKKVRIKRNEESKCDRQVRTLLNELNDIRNISHKYTTHDVSDLIEEIEGKLEQYKQLREIKRQELEILKKGLPKFLQNGDCWRYY